MTTDEIAKIERVLTHLRALKDDNQNKARLSLAGSPCDEFNYTYSRGLATGFECAIAFIEHDILVDARIEMMS